MLARARGLGTCPGIDSSAHVYPAGPVKFTLGERKVIEGLEEAVLNMHVGEGCCTAEPRTTLFLAQPCITLSLSSPPLPLPLAPHPTGGCYQGRRRRRNYNRTPPSETFGLRCVCECVSVCLLSVLAPSPCTTPSTCRTHRATYALAHTHTSGCGRTSALARAPCPLLTPRPTSSSSPSAQLILFIPSSKVPAEIFADIKSGAPVRV